MNDKLYPEKMVVEKDGYKVTVEFHGVFKEFVFLVAQAGDPRGQIILDVGKRRWKVGPSLFWGISFSGYGPSSNLNHYNGVLDRLINEAADDNIKLNRKLLKELLLRALAIYGFEAKNELECL